MKNLLSLLFVLSISLLSQAQTPVPQTYLPADNSTDVSIHTDLVLTFDIPISEGLVGKVYIYNAAIPGTPEQEYQISSVVGNDPEITIAGNTLTVDLNSSLNNGADYYITIDPTAINNFGGISATDQWNFTTEAITAPQILTYTPANSDTDISINTDLSLDFDMNITEGLVGSVKIYNASFPSTPEQSYQLSSLIGNDAGVNISGSNLTITLQTPLSDNSIYYILIDGTAINNFGGISDPNEWRFETESGINIQTYSPNQDDTDVNVNSNLVLTFDQAISAGTIGRVYLYDANSPSTPVQQYQISSILGNDPGVDITGSTLTITPISALDYETTYYILIDATALTDFFGISDENQWRFTTEIQPGPVVQTYTPIQDATDVNTSTQLILEFDQAISAGTAGNVSIYNTADISSPEQEYLISSIIGNDPGVNINGNTLSITLQTELNNSSTYYVLIDNTALTDYNGINNENTWRFTTTAIPAPVIQTYTPLQGATNVALSGDISIEFDINISAGEAGRIEIYNSSNPSSPEQDYLISSIIGNDAGVDITNNILTISLQSPLQANSNYYILLDETAISDFGGISDVNQWQFTTINNTVTDPTFTPAVGATDISIKPTLTMVFDAHTAAIIEENSSSIYIAEIGNTGNNIELKAGGGPNAQDNRISFTGNTITINLSLGIESLDANTNYAVYIEDNTILVDGALYYNELQNYTSWTFTTANYNQWLGTTSNFNDPSNWIGSANNYIINTSGLSPEVTSDISVDEIIINPGATLTIQTGVTLTVNESLTIESSINSNIGNGNLLIEGTLNSSGANVIVEQLIARDLEGCYISSPVIGANQSNIGISSTLWRRNAAQTGWQAMTPTEDMIEGHGYLGYGSSGELISFSGTINNNDVGPIVTYKSDSPNNFGWNLMGNPFPCSIDWKNIITTNMDNEFYILNNETEIYGVYNGAIDDGVNINPNNKSHIPSCHSFWVQVSEGEASGDILIPTSARATSNYTYLKSGSNNSIEKVRFAGINNNGFQDELLIAFSSDAQDNNDALDSEKRFSSKEEVLQLYTLHSDKKYTIDSYYNFAGGKTIEMGYKVDTPGTYKIKLTELANIEENVVIELEDLNEEETITMVLDDEYTFTTDNGTFENRFLIHIIPSGTTDINKPEFNDLLINIHSVKSQVYIKIPELTNPIFKIFSINGKLLQSGNLFSGITNKILAENEGLCIIQIISNEKTMSQKVFIKK